MKKLLIIATLLLSGCSIVVYNKDTNKTSSAQSSTTISNVSSSSDVNIDSSVEISSSSIDDKDETSSSSTASSSSSSTQIKESSTSSKESSASSSSKENSSSSSFNICEEKPGGKNEDGSDKLPIPCNKNNKIKIGNDNDSMTSFEFIDSLPDYFRPIYGNNFNSSKDLYYAMNNGGGYRIKMGGPNEPSFGIQTAMFETNLKLEIRINIGAMFNNSHGNEVDKDLPVMVIYGFDEDGKYLRKVEIEQITKSNENGTIKKYMDGTDVAYLELRALQCAYKSSQGYNYALLGLDLIAWPYTL